MKLSSIHEPIVEWPSRKPDPGYGLADADRSHFKYYIGKIQSELNKPISIPANYVNLYNKVHPSVKINGSSIQSFVNDYISEKFADASEFKDYTRLLTSPPNLPSDPSNYEFNITQDIILSLVPGEKEKVQEVYNVTNKQLRLYYFGVIRNDPAKAQAEKEKQVKEDINLFFFTINEDRRSFYSTKARAFYYNVLLTKKFIELLLNNFCEVYRASDSLYTGPKREWFGVLEQELRAKDVREVVDSMPQELIGIFKKAYKDIQVWHWYAKYKDAVPGADEFLNKTYKTTVKFENYFASLQNQLGRDNYEKFQNLILSP